MLGSKLKKLLVSIIDGLVADAELQPFTIVAFKIGDDASLCAGQVCEKGLFAAFDYLLFEA
jgi:hypothetical protein